MDSVAPEFAFLASALKRAVGDLRDEVRELSGSGQPSSQLSAYVLAALDAIDGQRERLEARFPSRADPGEAAALIRELRHLNLYARNLHETSGWLESARAPSISLGFLFYIREAGIVLLKETTDFVVHGGPKYNYSVRGLKAPFAQLLSEFGAVVPKGPSPVVLIYPKIEQGRTLLHPLFIHELGHEAVERHDLVEEVKRRYPDIGALDARFAQTVNDVVEEHRQAGRSISPQEAEARVRSVLNAWLDELLCDHLALAHLGPTFLLAAAAFLLPTRRSEPSETHPTAVLRLGSWLAFLDQLGWTNLLSERIPLVWSWLDILAKEPESPKANDHLSTFVRTAIAELMEPMRALVLEYLGSAFTPDDYRREAEAIEPMLRGGVPPIQLDSDAPAGRRQILLASWLDGLDRAGNQPSSLHEALGDLGAQKLVAETIEMTFVLEHWRSNDAAPS